MNIIRSLKNSIKKHITDTYSLDPLTSESLEITLNTTQKDREKFGDLSTTAPLSLSKKLKKAPREIAQEIIDTYLNSEVKHYIDKIEIAGPGFLNIFLTSKAFSTLTQELFNKPQQFYKPDTNELQKQNYSIEFVSTNPTGPMHLGHGRGGVIGDVLGNVLKFLGHNVTKEFYINDAGRQITKLGESFKIRCLQQLRYDTQLPDDAYHGQYLVSLAEKCVDQYGKDLLDFDQKFFENYAKDHLLKAIQQTLEFYGILFDVWFSEQVLHNSNAISEVLAFLQEKGFIYKKEGSLWFASTQFGDDKDRVVRKSNGELTYVSADIAYLQNKINRGFNKLIMILGQDHHGYVARLKAAVQALGYNKDMLDVILYQIVTLKEEGKTLRMSKRAGRSVDLQTVIDTVGKDVARFFYLNKKSDAHLNFDIELALKKTEENPVYYIQYAYVRTKSILSKAQNNPEFKQITDKDAEFLTSEEYTLLKKVASLESLLSTIERTYQTHLLSYYTIELAQLFHSYYGSCKIIDSNNIEQSRARLLLVNIIQNTLVLCFDLLGISTPEKM